VVLGGERGQALHLGRGSAGRLVEGLAEVSSENLTDECHCLRGDRLAASARPAQETPHSLVKGHQLRRLTARRALVDDRADTFERQQLPQERPEQDGAAIAGECRQRTHEHLEQLRHRMTFHRHLVDGLEHREGDRHLVEVFANGPEEVDDLGLRDDVELTALPAHDRDVGEEVEVPAELGLGLAHPLGDRPHLAVLRGDERDDAVRLAEAHRSEHDTFVPECRHCTQARALPR